MTPKAKIRFQWYAGSIFFATVYTACMTIRIKLWGEISELGFVMAIFGAAFFDSVFCIGFLLDPKYCAAVCNAVLRFGENFNRELIINRNN